MPRWRCAHSAVMSEPESRVVAWVGLLLAGTAILATLLLPGSRAWLCRNGLRFACDAGKTTIEKLGVRHQTIPPIADATMWLDVLASRVSFDGAPPRAIRCDEEDPYLDLYEKRYVENGGSSALRRGDSDYVMAEIDLAYPPSDIAFTMEAVITLQVPRREHGAAAFGLEAGPVIQHVILESPAGTATCSASFLLGLSKPHGLSTGAWPAGAYTADVSIRGGALAHKHLQFSLP